MCQTNLSVTTTSESNRKTDGQEQDQKGKMEMVKKHSSETHGLIHKGHSDEILTAFDSESTKDDTGEGESMYILDRNNGTANDREHYEKMIPQPFFSFWLVSSFDSLFIRYLIRLVVFTIAPLILIPIAVILLCVYLYLSWTKQIPKSDFHEDTTGRRVPLGLVKMPLIDYSTHFVIMRDGTRIAVDVWLPPILDRQGENDIEKSKVPIVFHQSRYYRSVQMTWPLNKLRFNMPYNLVSQFYFEQLLCRGIGVVSMDIRGSGASEGDFIGPWTQTEQDDALEVLEWIVNQDWCNGKIGTWGISYEATAALLLSTATIEESISEKERMKQSNAKHNSDTRTILHPLVKKHIVACMPMYPFLDMYQDIGFLGGCALKSFVGNWQKFNNCLDYYGVHRLGWIAYLFFDSLSPVKEKLDEEKVKHGQGSAEDYNDEKGDKMKTGTSRHGNNNNVNKNQISSILEKRRRRNRTWNAYQETKYLECADDPSLMNFMSSATHSPFVRLNKWLQYQYSDSQKQAENGQSHEANGNIETSVGLQPSFYFVSGWFDLSADCTLRLCSWLQGLVPLKLHMGPWNHAGTQHVRVYPKTKGKVTRSFLSMFPFYQETATYFEEELISKFRVEQINERYTTDNDSIKENFIVKKASCDSDLNFYICQQEEWALKNDACIMTNKKGKYMDCIFKIDFEDDIPLDSNLLYLKVSKSASCDSSNFAKISTHDKTEDNENSSNNLSRYNAMTELFSFISYKSSRPSPVSNETVSFTSPPLKEDVVIVGHPVIDLNVSSTLPDASIFVYLECVDNLNEDVQSSLGYYVTEGMFRVKYRREATYYHTQERHGHKQIDVRQLPAVPFHNFKRKHMKLLSPTCDSTFSENSKGDKSENKETGVERVSFPLLPCCFMFRKGQSIRVSIKGNDPLNFRKNINPNFLTEEHQTSETTRMKNFEHSIRFHYSHEYSSEEYNYINNCKVRLPII